MNQVTIELAVKALEAEKIKVQSAIAELKAGLNGRTVRRAHGAISRPHAGAVASRTPARRGRRRLSPAARRALSDAARRRWVQARAAGKRSL